MNKFILFFPRFALSLPSHITINGDSMKTHIHNTYDALGNRLSTTVNRSNAVYRDGELAMLLNGEDYNRPVRLLHQMDRHDTRILKRTFGW